MVAAGEEDRDPDGELPPRDRAAHQGDQGGLRGRGDGAHPGGAPGSARRVRLPEGFGVLVGVFRECVGFLKEFEGVFREVSAQKF